SNTRCHRPLSPAWSVFGLITVPPLSASIDSGCHSKKQIQAAQGAERYLLDQIRERLDLPGTLLAVRRLSGQWPNAHLKLVEDKANGPAVIQSLQHEIGGLVEVNPEGGKVSRAAAASPQLESGNWYLPHPMLKEW